MSASPKLKPSMRNSRKSKEQCKILQQQPGMLSKILQYFENHQEGPGARETPYKAGSAYNNNMLSSPLPGLTEHISTSAVPEMVSQSVAADRPIGREDTGHMIREGDLGPMGAFQPNFDQNLKNVSHI